MTDHASYLRLTAVFLLTICASCATGGHDDRPFTPKQVDRLAVAISQNTPEYLHFAPGSKFAWVVTDWDPQSSPPEVQEAVLRSLAEKYKVYRTKEQLPEELLLKADGKLRGYKGGFSFSFEVIREGSRTIKVTYADYEGMLAASGHWKRYKWTGTDWEIIEVSQMTVA